MENKFSKFKRKGGKINSFKIAPLPITKENNGAYNFFQLLANISQIFMIFIVAFGYFYTVVPVFQKEKISEDLARLELEKSKWKNEINKYENKVKNLNKNIYEIESKKKSLQDEISVLKNEHNIYIAKISSSNNKLNESIKNLEKIKNQLNHAHDELYESKIKNLTGETQISPQSEFIISKLALGSYSGITIFGYKDISEEDIEKKLESSYINPNILYDIVKNRLDESLTKSNSDIEKKTYTRILKEFESGWNKNKNLIECSTPNFNEWAISYRETISSDTVISSCLDYYSKNKTQDENNYYKRFFLYPQENSFNKKELYKSCKSTVIYITNDIFKKRWEEILEPCKERLFNFSAIILGREKSTLKPFSDMKPPKMNDIINAIEGK